MPTREEIIREVPVEREKIVQVFQKDTEVVEIPTFSERIVEVDRLKEVTNVVNRVEQ